MSPLAVGNAEAPLLKYIHASPDVLLPAPTVPQLPGIHSSMHKKLGVRFADCHSLLYNGVVD